MTLYGPIRAFHASETASVRAALQAGQVEILALRTDRAGRPFYATRPRKMSYQFRDLPPGLYELRVRLVGTSGEGQAASEPFAARKAFTRKTAWID